MRASLAVLLLLAGCAHEKLVAPPRDAPLAERQKAYEELKPSHVQRARVIGEPLNQWNRSLVLANKKEITEPVDLLQVVLPESETAKNVAAYEHKNRNWNVLAPVAGYGFGAGATLLTTGVVTNFAGSSGLNQLAFWMTLTGVIITIGVPIVSLIIGWVTIPDTEAERQAAWFSYDGDLKKRLDLEPAPQ